MGFIVATDQDGATRALEAVEGWRVMEILRDHGMEIRGLCGGGCECASCHIVIDDAWAGRLHPPRDDETAKLDELPILYEHSRLSCQIIWDESLDGLKLSIAPE